jgi:hypothetical protein
MVCTKRYIAAYGLGFSIKGNALVIFFFSPFSSSLDFLSFVLVFG